MRMTVQFENGMLREAVVLATAGNRLRVVVSGRRDAEEWLMIEGCCYDESGRRVGIEAIVSLDGIDGSAVVGDVYPRTATAGGLTN